MRGIDPRTSGMRSERSTIWATSTYPSSFELASEQNPWYISFQFVTSCQFLPLISKHQIELSKPQKVLEMRAIDPRTSRMQSERSTISATSLYPSSFELASDWNPWYISFRFVTSCQFLLFISKHQTQLSKPQKVLEMRGIDPRTSRMQSERSTISATFTYSSSFELASEQTSWFISCRFVLSSQFFSIVSQNKIKLSNSQKCSGDAGHRSRYLSHAKRELYQLNYIPALFKLPASFWTKFKIGQFSICNELPIFSFCQPEHNRIVEASKLFWRCGASIPVPLACEASALPFELHPRTLQASS